MDSTLPSYDYALCPLPHVSRDIRLIHVLPGEGSDLRCELTVWDKKVAFESLSWCWNSGADTYVSLHISHGNSTYGFPITSNLQQGLKALRHKTDVRLIWVDALCINQKSIDEKNAQVPLMGMIYRQASSVCVWLGPGDESTGDAMDFITNEIIQLENIPNVFWGENIPPDTAKRLVSLRKLMTKPWFTRRWVVQEIALSKSATLHCGDKSIAWDDFADAVSLFCEIERGRRDLSNIVRQHKSYNNNPDYYEHMKELGASKLVEAATSLIRRTSGSVYSNAPASVNVNHEHDQVEGLRTLEYLVSTLSLFESSEPRDTIYALLALAKDTIPRSEVSSNLLSGKSFTSTIQELLKYWGNERAVSQSYFVNYEQSPLQVWKDFISFSVKNADPTRALDILARPFAPMEKNGVALPSWIPRLKNRPFASVETVRGLGAQMQRVNADTLVGLPDLDTAVYKAAGSRNLTKAFKFENHEALKLAHDGFSKANASPEYQRKWPEFQDAIPNAAGFESMFVEGFELDTIVDLKERSQKGTIPQDWFECCGWKERHKSAPPEHFWRTLVANKGANGVAVPNFYARACEFVMQKQPEDDDVSLRELKTYGSHKLFFVEDYINRVTSVIWNKRMMRTSNNYIGLVPQDAKENDKICILFGCSVPVILRKVDKTGADLVFQRRARLAESLRQTGLKTAMIWRRHYNAIRVENSAKKEREKDNVRRNNSRPSTPSNGSVTSNEALPTPQSSPESTTAQAIRADLVTRIEESNPWADKEVHVCPKCGQPSSNGLSAEHKKDRAFSQSTHASTNGTTSSVAGNGPRYDEPPKEYYKFIGECYIHGMMNGEAVELHENEMLNASSHVAAQTRIFELR